MFHRWFLNVDLGIYKRGKWILRNNLCGVSERINQVNLDTIKKTPAGAGAHTLETTVCTDNCETFRGNINRMSPLLAGMFPLRIHACHQRK